MLEKLFTLSDQLIRVGDRPYQRQYFVDLTQNRFSILVGQRGVGKTTLLVQHFKKSYPDYLKSRNAIYVQADHFLVKDLSLYAIAERFHQLGGELICFDEIHKYPEWSRELKSITDTFPTLKILASGSSILEIHKGSHDLSRRAIVYHLPGLSFREFIALQVDVKLPGASLIEILSDHESLVDSILSVMEKKQKRILALFRDYLSFGYYPYFLEFEDRTLFHLTLEQNFHTSIESDLPAVYSKLSGASIKKISKLLAVIASSVPFTPDLRKIKQIVEIGDERTLKTYFKYLEDGGLIRCLSKSGSAMRQLAKPERIYLNNTNQIMAISRNGQENPGNIRETFFASMLSITGHQLSIPGKGDFKIDDDTVIEVGGKGKDLSQVWDINHSYLAADGIERGYSRKIPLWLFGFLISSPLGER
ncbi:MAG: AAA family ATPase [Thermodesulfobacteriota bacterium]|nr:AAA family ATPase [Thermodesulfobacteriota bacterium]